MHEGISADDGDRKVEWSGASGDYARFRPGPPDRLYTELARAGCGRPDQRVLDLGTGTGVVARRLAARGARVVGLDPAAGQLVQAHELARIENLSVQFVRGRAERLPFAPQSFDAATANQCWLYFDAQAMRVELGRVLAAGGLLATSHFSWLPREDPVAAASERLILEHNPDWSAGDWHGRVPAVPAWSRQGYRVRDHSVFDVEVPFTRESWRGRMRASRGIGATLTPPEVLRFDTQHAELLAGLTPEHFTVRHRVDWHLFELV